ncbi:MAG: O-antigen/teichoic acid export membrane protein [bacterium]|jgi:O-antigen/teichoic acid export membrane protein
MLSKGNKLIFDNAILLYTRLALTMIVGFLTTRIVLDELGATDYGTYFVVGGIVAIFSLLNGSMSGATQRWITIGLGEGNQERLNKIFAVGMTAQLVIIFIAILLYESLGLLYLYDYAVFPEERTQAIFWVFQFSVITAIIQLLSVPFMGAITAHEKMSALVYVAFIDVGIKISICILLPFISLDKLVFYAALILLAEILKMFFYIYYCKRFEEAKFKFAWDKIIFRDMWRIAFWSLSGNLAYMSYTVGITLLINSFFGPMANAAAGIASQAVNNVNQFRMNFQQAMNPQITKNFAQKNLLDMEKLVIRSSKFSQYLVVIFGIPLLLEAPFLLELWLKEVPEYTVEFLQVGLFVTMAMTIRAPLVTSAMASGNLKRYSLVVISILMLILPITYFAYKFGASPTTGPWISFFITCVAILASAYMLQDMTGLRLKYFLKGAILPALIVTIFSFIPPYLTQMLFDEGWVRLIIVSFISLFTTILIVYVFGLENGEKSFFKNKTIIIFRKLSFRK